MDTNPDMNKSMAAQPSTSKDTILGLLDNLGNEELAEVQTKISAIKKSRETEYEKRISQAKKEIASCDKELKKIFTAKDLISKKLFTAKSEWDSEKELHTTKLNSAREQLKLQEELCEKKSAELGKALVSKKNTTDLCSEVEELTKKVFEIQKDISKMEAMIPEILADFESKYEKIQKESISICTEYIEMESVLSALTSNLEELKSKKPLIDEPTRSYAIAAGAIITEASSIPDGVDDDGFTMVGAKTARKTKSEQNLEQMVKSQAIAMNPNHSSKVVPQSDPIQNQEKKSEPMPAQKQLLVGRVERVIKKFKIAFPPLKSNFGTGKYTHKPMYKVIDMTQKYQDDDSKIIEKNHNEFSDEQRRIFDQSQTKLLNSLLSLIPKDSINESIQKGTFRTKQIHIPSSLLQMIEVQQNQAWYFLGSQIMIDSYFPKMLQGSLMKELPDIYLKIKCDVANDCYHFELLRYTKSF